MATPLNKEEMRIIILNVPSLLKATNRRQDVVVPEAKEAPESEEGYDVD